MRKIVLFFIILKLSAFDIDDFDKGVDALNSSDFAMAYDIFYKGCEDNDELSCQELGLMYINGNVSLQLDNLVDKEGKNNIGLKYLLKSCKLGYINACSNILDLKKDIYIDEIIYQKALKQYENLITEF